MGQKSILITGAASGIGRETALFFAQKGWFVGIFDIDEAGVKGLESEISTPSCFSGIMDVSDPVSVKAGIDAFGLKTGGKLDILLNNAGIIKFGLYENIPLEDHHQIVEVNFKGCLNCIYYGLPHLKRTRGSRIINMSSISSLYGTPDAAVYSSTKHALSAMTEALDIELAHYGIIVCDIKPPYVRTPMLKDGKRVKSLKTLSALGGQIDPEKVVKTIWKAAHRKKLHWHIGLTNLIVLQFWLMPFFKRFLIKLFAMPRIRN